MKTLTVALLFAHAALACSNLTFPGSGVVGNGSTDDTAAIQSNINSNAGCSLEFTGTHAYLISAVLTLPSHSHLVLDSGATIFLKNGSVLQDTPAVLTNANYTSGNTDITIQGRGTINANGTNQTFSMVTYWPGVTIQFLNVSNSMVYGITILDSLTYHIECSMCTNVQFTHLVLNTSITHLHTDGINMHVPLSFIAINNISGTIGDDVIAMGSADPTAPFPVPVTTGNVSDVLVESVNVNSEWNFMRAGVSLGQSISRLFIQNIAGSVVQSGAANNGVIWFGNPSCANSGTINVQFDRNSATAGSGDFIVFDQANVTITYSNNTGSSTIVNAGGCSGVTATPVSGPTPPTNFNWVVGAGTSLDRGVTVVRGASVIR